MRTIGWVAGVAAVLACCPIWIGSGGLASAAPTPPMQGGAVLIPTGAYLGAWINPSGDAGTEEAQTEAFESAIGRPFALHMQYARWSNGTAPSIPNADIQADLNHGRISVVTWACGDDNAKVASGADDQLLLATAEALKKFGGRIFLRWNWEMNLKDDKSKCAGTAGADGYVQAWRHIYSFFKDHGVTNVSMLWNPGLGDGKGNWAQYYPGDDYVDWIGFDGYDKKGANDFGAVFNPFYQALSSKNKPILIAETGECAATQAQYISSAQSEIEGKGGTVGYRFPLVHGFMYFDSMGKDKACADGEGWTLGAAGQGALKTIGSDAYFSAK